MHATNNLTTPVIKWIRKLFFNSLMVFAFSFSEGQILEHLSPLPNNYFFKEASFISEKDGWAVDDYTNKLLRTYNGGKSWKKLIQFKSRVLSLKFTDPKNGFVIVNDSTQFHYTNDGGVTWHQGSLPIKHIRPGYNYYNKMFVADAKHLWIYRYHNCDSIISSKDGGLTWSQSKLSFNSSYDVTNFFFTDSLHGFEYFRNSLFKTMDGGLHWTLAWSFNNSEYIKGLYFTDSVKGMCLIADYNNGKNWIYASTIDGAMTWTFADTIKKNCNLDQALYAFADSLNGCIIFTQVSCSGTSVGDISLRVTHDGGHTWQTKFLDGKLINGLNISAAGKRSYIITTTDAEVLFSNDKGEHWHKYGSKRVEKLPNDFSLFDEHNGFSFENDSTGSFLTITDNGGQSWSKSYPLPPNLYSIRKVIAANSNTVALINRNYNYEYHLQLTRNKGQLWTDNPFPQGTISYCFNSLSHIWCCTRYNIYQSTDTGKIWTVQFQSPIQIFNGGLLFHFTKDNKCGRIVTQEQTNKLFFTNDGGTTWNFQTINFNKYSSCMFFIDSMKGWIAADKLYKTEDGGFTWHIKHTHAGNETMTLNQIFFYDSLNGWIIGGRANKKPFHHFKFIAHTIDGGLNWITDVNSRAGRGKYNYNGELYGGNFINRHCAYITGRDFEWYKMTDNFIEPVDGSCSISAFPNPANVSCTINLSCFGESDKLIYVYDELGHIALKAKVGKADSYIIENEMLRDGVYYIHVESSGQSAGTKLVVLRKNKL